MNPSEELPQMEVATPKDLAFRDAVHGWVKVRDEVNDKYVKDASTKVALYGLMDKLMDEMIHHMNNNENLDEFNFRLDEKKDGSKVVGVEGLANLLKREGEIRTLVDKRKIPDGSDLVDFDSSGIPGLWLETVQYKSTFGSRDEYCLVGKAITLKDRIPPPPSGKL